MAVKFTKLSNGNVIFEDEKGNEHNFGQKVYIAEHEADTLMIIPEIMKKGFVIDWNDVTLPVVVSRQDLFDKLTQDFFFSIISEIISPDGLTKVTVDDAGNVIITSEKVAGTIVTVKDGNDVTKAYINADGSIYAFDFVTTV